MLSEYQPPQYNPPEYQPPKKCLRTTISPGLIFGILWYDFSLSCFLSLLYIFSFQVIVIDKPVGICSSSGDPHMHTPDGLTFHNYFIGDYVLMRNRRRDFEVSIILHDKIMITLQYSISSHLW